jgi:type VI secretion system protein ImpI
MALLLILTLEGTAQRRQLDAGCLTVGRAENNDWVLADPAAKPAMSRRHCRFDITPQGATVTDLGSTNGTRVDGQLLTPHTPAPLYGGELVEIGMRLIMVELVEAAAVAEELPPPDPPSANPASGAGSSGVPRRKQPRAPAGPAQEPASKSRPPPDTEHDPFGLGVPDRRTSPRPETSAAPARSRRERSSAGTDRNRGAPATKTDDVTAAVLRAAFLAGSRLPASTADDRPPVQFFREAGRLFTSLADGLRELLAVRAVIKDQAGLDRTQIGATLNNPLKLAASAQEAAAALLGKPADGCMDPLAAVAASFRDLKAHELAVLDGVRSAVDELLELFNPSTLERELDDSGMLANLLQGGRRARLWELYHERYEDIALSARNHFMGRLDDAFREGYARKSAEVSESAESPVAPRPGTFRS